MDDDIRVCQIISSFRPVIGGAERVTENLCAALVRLDTDIVILTRRYPGLPHTDTVAGIPVYRLGHPSRSKAGALTFALHALLFLALRLRAYRIVHVQNIDTPLLIGLLARTFLGRRLVATIHGEAKLVMKRESWLGRLRLWLMRRLVDMSGALSPAMQEELAGEGIAASRIRLIPNGVDTTVFRPPTAEERGNTRRELGLAQDAVVVLFVGRLVALKRVDLLLRAWSQLPLPIDRQLLIVGDGPEQESLQQLATALGQHNIRFAGATNTVALYHRAADIFVLPSEREGLSVALLEAMAAGLTVVASALPGLQAVIDDRHNGLLFPVDDADALRNCLRTAIQSPALRRRLGEGARCRIMEQYSLQATADMHRKMYKSLLGKS